MRKAHVRNQPQFPSTSHRVSIALPRVGCGILGLNNSTIFLRQSSQTPRDPSVLTRRESLGTLGILVAGSLQRGPSQESLRAHVISASHAVFTVWRTLTWRLRIPRKQLWTKGEWEHISQKEEVNVIKRRKQWKAALEFFYPPMLCVRDSCPRQGMSGAHEPAVTWGKGYSQERIKVWVKTWTQSYRHIPFSQLSPRWEAVPISDHLQCYAFLASRSTIWEPHFLLSSWNF